MFDSPGRGASRIGSRGRLRFELDVTKDFEFSNGAYGNWGVFIGAESDSDFSNGGVVGGAVYRLNF